MRRKSGTNWFGWFFIVAGMIYLMLPSVAMISPLSTVSFGNIKLEGVSEFSAVNTFIGIVLIAIGIFVSMKRRVF